MQIIRLTFRTGEENSSMVGASSWTGHLGDPWQITGGQHAATVLRTRFHARGEGTGGQSGGGPGHMLQRSTAGGPRSLLRCLQRSKPVVNNRRRRIRHHFGSGCRWCATHGCCCCCCCCTSSRRSGRSANTALTDGLNTTGIRAGHNLECRQGTRRTGNNSSTDNESHIIK